MSLLPSLLRDRARPATKARVTSLILTAVVAARAPDGCETTNNARTATSVALGTTTLPVWHSADGDVALLTEQARGGVRQV